MDSYFGGRCKYCEEEIIHSYNRHIFYTLDSIENCKYINKVANHFKNYHPENNLVSKFIIGREYFKKVFKGIIKDILMILMLPFSFTISVLYKVFEWLNDRIGMFD